MFYTSCVGCLGLCGGVEGYQGEGMRLLGGGGLRTQTFTHSSATLANRLRTPDREMEAGERRKEGGRDWRV